jgi:hypothetical protein
MNDATRVHEGDGLDELSGNRLSYRGLEQVNIGCFPRFCDAHTCWCSDEAVMFCFHALDFRAFHFELIQYLWYDSHTSIRCGKAYFPIPQCSQYGALKWTVKFRHGDFDGDVLRPVLVTC